MARQSIANRLRCQIELMRADEPLPTEAELARSHGVSYSTVRRVTDQLRREGFLYKKPGRGTFVAERPPVQGELATIIYGDTWNVEVSPYFNRCVQGIMASVERLGFRIQVMHCPMNAARSGESVAKIKQAAELHDVKGVLLPWVTTTPAAMLREAIPDLRIVNMSGRYSLAGVSCVGLDYDALGHQAYQYLASLECRRPVLVSTQAPSRYGAMAAQEATGGVEMAMVRVDAASSFDDVSAAVDALIDLAPDGVAVDDDVLAAACIAELQRRGAQHILDLPLVCHANHGQDTLPTTAARLRVDGFDVGASAVRLLHYMIAENLSLSATWLTSPNLELPYVSTT